MFRLIVLYSGGKSKPTQILVITLFLDKPTKQNIIFTIYSSNWPTAATMWSRRLQVNFLPKSILSLKFKSKVPPLAVNTNYENTRFMNDSKLWSKGLKSSKQLSSKVQIVLWIVCRPALFSTPITLPYMSLPLNSVLGQSCWSFCSYNEIPNEIYVKFSVEKRRCA